MGKDLVELVETMSKEMCVYLTELCSGFAPVEKAQDVALNLPASSAHPSSFCFTCNRNLK
jgi:hypothetical protein